MILIAPDKFKGSLTAHEAAEAIAAGLADAGCVSEMLLCPMADGGEGMPDSIAGCPVVAVSDYVGTSNSSLMALPLIDRSSRALGDFLMARHGPGKPGLPPKVWVGVGGTMTADGGAGLLQALGARLYAADGTLLTCGPSPRVLPEVSRLDMSDVDVDHWRGVLHALSDVEASLTGPGLSALDFTAQKGASGRDREIIKNGLERLSALVGRGAVSAIDGAGGGIGFALATVLGVPWSLGAQVMLEESRVPWGDVSLVISGEGRIDGQTAGGKVVETVRRAAESRNIPFAAIGGYVESALRIPLVVSTIDCEEDYDPRLAAERLRMAAASLYDRLKHRLNPEGCKFVC